MDLPAKGPEVIERIQACDGEIQLQRRGKDYEIIYNGVFIMSTYNGVSEQNAVTNALDILIAKDSNDLKEIKVLLGGLGMGYSLRAALDCPFVTGVTVAEFEPAVIRWNHNHLQSINGCALNDNRTEVYEGDFYHLLTDLAKQIEADKSKRFHLIMVDTDNGSTWLSRPGNFNLYNRTGIRLIKNCLHDKGIASFWCADREAEFEKLLENEYNSVSFHTVLEKTGQEGCYYLACMA